MASLLSGTTIGGHVAVHANNISTYALTSVPSNVITTSGGQTIAGITYFSNGESLNLYGIRGRFTNEYIHLYEKVGIGHPAGWGQGQAETPTQGLSTYGGMNIAYGNGANSYINGYLRINKNWAGGDFGAEQLTIRGTYPSIALRSTQHNSKWLIHHASALQFYYGGTSDDNNWANKFEIPTDGNIWMAWANANISTLLDAKQNASTAITTSNISSQSVSVAEFQSIPDARGNAYTPNDYTGNRIWWHFNNKDTVGGYGTYWHAIQTVSPWSSYDPSHRQQQIQWGGTDISFRYATSGTTWSSWFRFITDANIASQSVSYADESGYSGSTGSVEWTNVNSRPTALSQFTNNLGNYGNWITTDGRAYPRRSDGTSINFYWDGQSGQPTWLWGSNNGTDFYVWNPSNFSVNFANSSTSTAYLNYTSVGSTQLNANTFSYGRASNYYGTSQILNAPEGAYASLYNFGGTDFSTLSLQMFASVNHNDTSSTRNLWFRVGNNLGFQNDWKQLIHSGNIASQSVSYADESGYSGSTGSVEWTNVNSRPTALSQFTNDLGNYGGWLTTSGKAADSELIDGIDSSRIVYGDGANGRSINKTDGNANVSDSSNASGFYFGVNVTGMPTADWWNWLTVRGNGWSGSDGYQFQLAGSFWGDDYRIRRMTSGANQAWVSIIHSGNIGSQSVNYAATAGSAPANGGTSTYATYLNPLSGDSNYKLAYTADGARNNAGEWGRAVMYYVPNGQTYGIRVDRADYADSAGAVAWGNVSSKPSYIMYYQGFELNANTMDSNSTGFTYANNAPFYGPIARFSTGGGYDLWLGGSYNGGGNAFYLRTRNGDAGTFNAWREIITSGNIASQSVSYADESGYSASSGSVEWTSVQNKPATFTPSAHNHDDRYYTESESDTRYAYKEGSSGTNFYANAYYQYEWTRIMGSGSKGIYWQEGDGAYWHIYPRNQADMRFRTGSGNGGIVGTVADETARGYIHWTTSNEIGFLSEDRNWVLRTYNRGVEVYGELRAPIFYDSSDTTFYVDPNSSSRVRNLYVGDGGSNWSDPGGWGTQLHVSNGPHSIIRVYARNEGIETGMFSHTGGQSKVGSFTNHDFSIVRNFSDRMIFYSGYTYANGYLQAADSLRAPIFYDSNDTTYYLDPNGGAYLRGRVDVVGGHGNSSFRVALRPEENGIGTGVVTLQSWCSEPGNSWDGAGFGYNVDNNSNTNAPSYHFGRPNPNFGQAFMRMFPDGSWRFYNATTGAAFSHTMTLSSDGHVTAEKSLTSPSVTSLSVLVNNHSDNTRGYRIHNTSGSSVSAMFTNSANALVIGAGAFDQVQLNKKVLVSGAALGVNVAASATAGRIDASNDIVAYSSSDERLKHNITPIENALDKVKSLTGVEFDWKPEYKHAHGYEGHDTGIIAQQVQEVIPSAVRTNDTGFLAVRYEKLIGLLVEGMKEQQAQIDELKAKLDGIAR
jgi:hypothetical protein